MDRDALGMASVVGPAVVELWCFRINAHLGIPYQAPSTAAATEVMMDHDPVTDLDVPDSRSHPNDLAARLMSHRFELGQVSPLAPGRPERSKVASAES